MKNFNSYMEALLLAVKPSSDSVGQVDQVQGDGEEAAPTDMMSSAADQVLKNLGIQTDDGVGETGEIQADGDMEGGQEGEGGVSLECLGERGMRVSFNGMEIVLPREVVDQIKGYEGGEDEGSEEGETGSGMDDGEGEEAEEGETEEHEESESPDFEAGEEEEAEENEEEEEEEKEFGESFKPFIKGEKKDAKSKKKCCKCDDKKGKFDFSQLKKK